MDESLSSRVSQMLSQVDSLAKREAQREAAYAHEKNVLDELLREMYEKFGVSSLEEGQALLSSLEKEFEELLVSVQRQLDIASSENE